LPNYDHHCTALQQNDMKDFETLQDVRKSIYEKNMTVKDQHQRRLVKKMQMAKQAEADAIQKAIQDAKDERRRAYNFLAQSVKKFDRTEIELAMQEEANKRMEAHKELKRNTEKAKDKIKAVIEKKAKKESELAKHEEAEMKRIYIAGGNPFEILRERKEKEKAEKNLKQLRKKQEKMMQQIDDRIALENKRLEQYSAKKREEKQTVRDFYEKHIGKRAVENKMQTYMREKTIAGVDIIDPLRKETALYPSKVMAAKDNRFGLGQAHELNETMLMRMIEKYPTVSFNERAVPKLEVTIDKKDESDKKPALDFDEESDEELAVPEYEGLW